jgi:hypothetical protein
VAFPADRRVTGFVIVLVMVRTQLTPEKRKYVESMFVKHAAEINGETPAQVALATSST